MRETLVKPLGLVTEPNKYGVYPPGALSEALNVHMRAPGTLTQMSVASVLTYGDGADDSDPARLFSTGAQLLVIDNNPVGAGWRIVWVEADGTTTAATFEDTAGIYPNFNGITVAGHYSIVPILFRGRTLVNSASGVIVADYVDPTSTDERMFRYAGLVQPLMYTEATADGQAIAASDVVTYSCLLQRTYADGYILISEPAPLHRVKNFDVVTRGADITVRWGVPTISDESCVRADDIIEIYRSPPVASPSAGLNTDSGNVLYHVLTHVITAAEVTAGAAVLVDTSGETAWGKELYTNPGAEAAQAPRRRPPTAMTCASFKGFAFYSNLIYPPQWRVGWPGGFGTLTTAEAREHGIGARPISGTFNAGVNPTIITAVLAADLVGVVAGQYLTSATFPTASGGARVVSVGPTTITMDVPATLSGVKTFSAADVLEIDGVEYPIPSLASFIRQLCAAQSDISTEVTPIIYSIVTEPTITYDDSPGITIFDQRMILESSRFNTLTESITVRGTNGQNYDPPIPLLSDAVKTIEPTPEPNLTTWSWLDQPEAVAPPNSTAIGYGTIYASIATRDALWFHASDGLYRLTGYGTRSSGIGAQWRVDLMDKTLVLASPLAYTVLRDQIYSHTNRGFVQIVDNGVRELSTGIIGDILAPARMDPAGPFDYFLEADDENDEVWLGVRDIANQSMQWFVYSVMAQAYTNFSGRNTDGAPLQETRAFAYVDFLRSMVFAQVDSPLGAGVDWLDYFDPDVAYAGAPATATFQPVSAGDPLTAKQWIDITLIFSVNDAIEDVRALANGVESMTGNLVAKQNDSRCAFGVPRRAPAIGHTLAPGYLCPDSDGCTQFYGLSLRFEILSEQQVFRR